MDIVWYGLKVAFVGMLVVFVGLALLIACIRALAFFSGKQKPEDPQAPGVPAPQLQQAMAPAPQPAPPPPPQRFYVPGPRLTRKDSAFYAVLTAAIARTLEAEGINPEGGFIIRDVKTVSEPIPGPALTPRDDAFYAVVTAAVGSVLEAEGVNPEGGFAIRSVKAL